MTADELVVLTVRVPEETRTFVRSAKALLNKSQGEVVVEAVRMYEQYLARLGILPEHVRQRQA